MFDFKIFYENAFTEMNTIKYYTEQDKPLRGLPDSDLINQDLITAFRKQFGMIDNDFNMVLTDFDMKVKVSSKKTTFCVYEV